MLSQWQIFLCALSIPAQKSNNYYFSYFAIENQISRLEKIKKDILSYSLKKKENIQVG